MKCVHEYSRVWEIVPAGMKKRDTGTLTNNGQYITIKTANTASGKALHKEIKFCQHGIQSVKNSACQICQDNVQHRWKVLKEIEAQKGWLV